MARIRSIKPSFFHNEDLADLPMQTRMLFIGLWTLADRRGRMEDRPKRIKAALFPYDDIDSDKALLELQNAGFIIRYNTTLANGNIVGLIQIPAFEKHQRISGDEAKKESEYPAPPVSSNQEASEKQAGIQDEAPKQLQRSEKEASEKQVSVRSTVLLSTEYCSTENCKEEINSRALDERTPEAIAPVAAVPAAPVAPSKPVGLAIVQPEQPERKPAGKQRGQQDHAIFKMLWDGLIGNAGIRLADKDRQLQAKSAWLIVDRIVAQFDHPDQMDATKGILGGYTRLRKTGGKFWGTQPSTPLALSAQGTWGQVLESMRTHTIDPEVANFIDEMEF